MFHIIARTIIVWTTIIAICNYNYNGDHRSRYNHNKPLHTHTTRRIINAATGNNNYDTLDRVARETRNWRSSREHRPDNLRRRHRCRRRRRRTERTRPKTACRSLCQCPSRNRRNRRAEDGHYNKIYNNRRCDSPNSRRHDCFIGSDTRRVCGLNGAKRYQFILDVSLYADGCRLKLGACGIQKNK